MEMTVWLDEELCNSCGNCVDIAPEVFEHVDRLAHVKENGQVLDSMGVAFVPPSEHDVVIAAAEECPGEIIYVNTATH